MIAFKTRVGMLRHLPGMRYLEIPARVVKDLGGKFRVRLVCVVKTKTGSVSFQGGLVALGEGKGYISITQARLKKIGAEAGSLVSVTLTPDKSKFGMELPKEMKELFKQDPAAKKRFDLLTPGRQRTILFYVAQVKSSDLRLERAYGILENIKRLPVGKEAFRQMVGMPPRKA